MACELTANNPTCNDPCNVRPECKGPVKYMHKVKDPHPYVRYRIRYYRYMSLAYAHRQTCRYICTTMDAATVPQRCRNDDSTNVHMACSIPAVGVRLTLPLNTSAHVRMYVVVASQLTSPQGPAGRETDHGAGRNKTGKPVTQSFMLISPLCCTIICGYRFVTCSPQAFVSRSVTGHLLCVELRGAEVDCVPNYPDTLCALSSGEITSTRRGRCVR